MMPRAIDAVRAGRGLLRRAAARALRAELAPEEAQARHSSPRSRFGVLGDGARMHYLAAGAADAPALVLVHGSFDSAFTWERVIDRLADDFRVIAPDLPGHGLTGRTAEDRYAIGDMARALGDLLDALGVESAHLVGNSMGGNVAWRFALERPAATRRLVLISASGYPGSALLLPGFRDPITRWLYHNVDPTPVTRLGLRRAVVDPSCIDDAYVVRSVDFLCRRGARHAHALRSEQRRGEEQPIAPLGDITAPTLVVWGERDRIVPVAHAHRFHADLPGSELTIYEAIGHAPQLETPERLASDLSGFLRR